MNSSNQLTDTTIKTLAHHELLLPGLLFLTGHRPLAFVAGQFLHILAPAASMLGIAGVHDWAALLSNPRQVMQLQGALEDAATD